MLSRSVRRLSISLAAVLMGGAACSSGSAASAPPSSLAVHLDGGHFAGVPTHVNPGLVRLRFTNDGTSLHMAAIGLLAGGHRAADLQSYFATPAGRDGPPSWLRLVGGVDELAAGHQGGWTGILAPGSYVIASLSTDATGRPDIVDGLLSPFTVPSRTATRSPAPPAQATVTLGAGGTLALPVLPAGTTSIRVANNDGMARTVDVTSIRAGRTFGDVQREAQQGQGVPPSLVRLGGTSVPAHGSVVIGIEPANRGTHYVIFDIDFVSQGAIVDRTAS